MSNIVKAADYSILSGDQFFFDANIWIFLFCPIGASRQRKQNVYSDFLKYVRSRGNSIHVNSLVLSEFVNAWLHIEHKLWTKTITNSQDSDYKRDYVGSLEYVEVTKAIRATLNTILGVCTKNNDDFQAIEINDILTGLTKRDFNDNYYLKLAKRKGWHILTDDADLFDSVDSIKIITA